MSRFQGRTVLITGATGGIGRDLARAYSELGASAFLTDLPNGEGEKLARELRTAGGKATFYQADLAEAESAALIMDAAQREFGRIDILINNAGFGIWKSPLELSIEEWDSVLNVNLRGTFLCSREAAKVMKRQGTGGAIVNIASTRAVQSEPNSEAYAASKGGILSITHALALSLGPDRIRVNAISPGWIDNGKFGELRPEDHEQHPAGRVGTTMDIARACFYLTDPDNDFVTGINLTVDGGMTRKMIYVE
ncbi:SDR family NAD(P)-dependent oxidoreductase [Cohnella thailandensis]|uniref:SDR family oxidoreductase n=1 Tax=Cohnella thailandensis TaxID=557557 RepID=A0A841SXM9_9BACL|nr:SDR family oxidoreductase [Cohnella thailandensis]MBB6636993.1 SDR family oxidoreductase [Cohnella thailandensis]MBP1973123.1 NAD(P)-dependent dehydrogenase (short-subunit alcohol dehydrogenase family) [Cohnella thailandensis]